MCVVPRLVRPPTHRLALSPSRLRLLVATFVAVVTVLGCSSYQHALRQYRAGDAQGALSTLAVYGDTQDAGITTLRGLAQQRLAFEEADRMLAENRYPEAMRAFDRARMGSALTSSEHELANQGYCLAALRVPSARDRNLLNLCMPYAEARDAQQPRLVEIRRLFTPFVEEGLKTALAAHSPDATEWLSTYLTMPDAKPSVAKHAEQTLVNRNNAQREHEVAEQRRAQIAREARAAETRAHLAERYGGVRGATREEFIRALESTGTIVGLDLFTDVTINKNVLALGVPGPEYIFPNVRLFARYNDIFAVWCDCDAHTNVYWDMRVTGGQTAVLATFSVNSDSGMSQMDH